MSAALILNLLTLVQAGFKLEDIAADVQAKAAAGASDDDISKYLQDRADAAVAALVADAAK